VRRGLVMGFGRSMRMPVVLVMFVMPVMLVDRRGRGAPTGRRATARRAGPGIARLLLLLPAWLMVVFNRVWLAHGLMALEVEGIGQPGATTESSPCAGS